MTKAIKMTKFLKIGFFIPFLILLCGCDKKDEYFLMRKIEKKEVIFAEAYLQTYYTIGEEWLGPDRIGVWTTGKYRYSAYVDFDTIRIKKEGKVVTYTLPAIKFKGKGDGADGRDGLVYKSTTLRRDFTVKEKEEARVTAIKTMEKEYFDEEGKYSKELKNELINNAKKNSRIYLTEFTKTVLNDDEIIVKVNFDNKMQEHGK